MARHRHSIMNARARKVLEEALELSAEDRALLVATLEATLEDEETADATANELEKAWMRELDARIDDVAAGVAARDVDEVLAELRARYARR
jgi:hypothetical protein